MEFMLGLLLSWPFWAMLICGSLLFTHLEWYFWGMIVTVVLGVITWQLLNLSWFMLTLIAITYIPVGFVWSFFRWKKHCNKMVVAVEEDEYDEYVCEKTLNVSQNVDKIAGWVMLWPFSLLDSFIGDLIDMITNMIKTIFRKTYMAIASNSLARIAEIEAKRKEERVEVVKQRGCGSRETM